MHIHPLFHSFMAFRNTTPLSYSLGINGFVVVAMATASMAAAATPLGSSDCCLPKVVVNSMLDYASGIEHSLTCAAGHSIVRIRGGDSEVDSPAPKKRKRRRRKGTSRKGEGPSATKISNTGDDDDDDVTSETIEEGTENVETSEAADSEQDESHEDGEDTSQSESKADSLGQVPTKDTSSDSDEATSAESENDGSAVASGGAKTETPKGVVKAAGPDNSASVQIPNAVFRLLLRQGRIGHTLVMLMVIVDEWLDAWVHPLSRILSALLIRVFPPRTSRRRTRRPRPTQSSTAAWNARTGMSDKTSSKLSRQADAVAMDHLQSLGQDAKYRWISAAFRQRHGLNPAESNATSTAITTTTNAMTSVKADREEDEEDADWVVTALTEEPRKRPKSSFTVKPTVSVNIGTSGPEISVGIDIQRGDVEKRKTAIVRAVTKEPKRTKSAARRVSDDKGGDGIFGHLRTISGANSAASRTLFGAYPRDAPAIDEAASRQGLFELAQKYDYGSWSDPDDFFDVDDGSDNGDIRRPKRTRRRKRRRSSSSRSQAKAVETTRDIARGQLSASSKTNMSWSPPPLSNSKTLHKKTMSLGSPVKLDSTRRQSVVGPAQAKLDALWSKKAKQDD